MTKLIQLILLITILVILEWVVNLLIQREVKELKGSIKMYKQWIKNGKESLTILNEKMR